jgi:hypothetical protein
LSLCTMLRMGEAPGRSPGWGDETRGRPRLDVMEDVIRKRIQRGSIRHERAMDGPVWVWVDKIWDWPRTQKN